MPRARTTHRILAFTAILSTLLAPAASTQTPPLPRFDAATLKPGGDIFSTRPQLSPGRILWTTQLAYLIAYAYDFDSSRVSGSGIGATYTLNAVFPPNTTNPDLRRMCQSLLADRFNLRFHKDIQQVDGFALTLAKTGLKIKRSATPPPGDSYLSVSMTSRGVLSVDARNASLPDLARALARAENKPFFDQTGLHGQFDFAFTFSDDPAADPQAADPSLATALRETLGLSLHRQKGPLETLVIDHLDPPSAN